MGGSIELTYRYNKIGIRTLLDGLISFMGQDADTELALDMEGSENGIHDSVGAVDLSHFQVVDMLEANSNHSFERKQAEARKLWYSCLFAASFSIPIAIISMVFTNIPGTKHYFHGTMIFWNITVEEFITFILATPVQFISGAKFYKESYYSLKNGTLGMGILIAMGTTAAYTYSIFVVLYNAIYIPKERLMQAFETSALLITFVLLGKYLEFKAKARTSNAITKLAKLVPDNTSLIGVMEDETPEQQSLIFVKEPSERLISVSLVQKNDVLLI